MVYLYEFTFWTKPRDGTLIETWTQTNFEQALTTTLIPGATFSPQPGITHADITYDGETAAGQIVLTVPRDHPVAAKFLAGYPYGTVKLRVIEQDLVSGASQFIWTGRIRSCAFAELTAAMTGTDGREMLQRLGLRLNAGRNCQWDLYGTQCGLNEATYTRTGTVTSVSSDGLTVHTSFTEADDFFKAGTICKAGERRMIVSSVGTGGVLTLMTALSSLTAGDAITATRGCDRTNSATTGCKAFGNYLHYSGFADFDTPQNIFSKGVL